LIAADQVGYEYRTKHLNVDLSNCHLNFWVIAEQREIICIRRNSQVSLTQDIQAGSKYSLIIKLSL